MLFLFFFYKFIGAYFVNICKFCNFHICVKRGGKYATGYAPGGPVKLDSMWQHRLTRLVRDRYMYSIRITV